MAEPGVEILDRAYAALAQADPALGRLAGVEGLPDPFAFPDGGRTTGNNFAAMVLHIIGQQISTKVALILYDRLVESTGGPPTPESVLGLDVDRLRALGMSHSKATYLRALADAVTSGSLPVDELGALTDQEAVDALTRVKGIGPWSAEMFLIHQLRRPDILPAGDLGIRIAVQRLDALEAVPGIEEVRNRGRRWAPYRTYAAALLWRSLG